MGRDFTKAFELIKRFDDLPDDAVISTKITAIILGCADRTVRYHPKLTRIQISNGRYGFRVGNVRSIARGEAIA